VDSTSHIGESGNGTATTSSKGEVQGQAGFIVNASLEYTHPEWGTARILYNTIGKRLAFVGPSPQPDVYEQRRDQLDLVFLKDIQVFDTPLTAKLAFENLTNDDYVYKQGGDVQQKYNTGVKISFGLSYSY